ncbi:non-homologous end joining protein Ku [Aquincola tertiaricarbonis]|uniref:non-homologous end joining protein Ku n=1 Tax=Aquincola tertiaricarbonis TaxID=391953 RepID=UPI0006152183|nr:Ku protein [Aquincola tertiaricarbonis]
MPRVIWKGAISFGLVYVPVALYPGAQDTGISFDWLDKRSMDPVGYKRINKRTGKDIDKENIVKGLKQDTGDYVILSEEEINAAYPKSTQVIEIEHFVKADEIPFTYLEKPYLLAPIGKGEKVYALLREAMIDAGVIAVARVVMHTKESLAALIPDGDALLLNTLRWAKQVRSRDELKLPAAGKKAVGLKDAELAMAQQLISEMVTDWDPNQYEDRFSDAIHALAAKKVEAGETAQVAPLENPDEAPASSNVVDLSDLLRRSLASRKPGARPTAAAQDDADEESEAPPARKPAAKAAAKKAAAKTASTAASSKKAPAKTARKTPARKAA